MTLVKLIVDKKTEAFCSTSEIVPDPNETVFREDGAIAYGDGVTQIKNLTFVGGSGAVSSVNGQTGAVSLDASDVGADPTGSAAAAESNANDYTDTVAATKQDRLSALLTGGVITVETIDGTGTLNDIRVTAATYYIEGLGSYSAAETTFLNIALSSSNNQRYIGIYATSSNTIVKVEGSESSLASYPSTPANSFPIGYLLVTSAAVAAPVDLSGYLLKADKATAADVAALTNDTKYLTPFSIRGIAPITYRLISDFSTSSSSFVDVSGLSVSLLAGKKYEIELYFVMQQNPTNGTQASFVFPTGTNNATTRSTINDMITRRFAYHTATFNETFDAGVFGCYAMINLYTVVSADSVFKVQIRSITGGNTSTVRGGITSIRVREVI